MERLRSDEYGRRFSGFLNMTWKQRMSTMMRKLLITSDGAIVGWATVSRDYTLAARECSVGPLLPS